MFEQVHHPSQLKQMNTAELLKFAEEIRAFLVKSVSETGGHFGANLGVVELTLALHKVFDSPSDKIVWDVGHQAYVHKLLTGRREGFASLRQYGGMSGFPKREESEHDQFGVGHASTSISAALGMAVARDLQHHHNAVVAVIGDGALTGGMAMEALNHAGHLGTNMLVILNDNEMSISENVGALSTYLTKLRADPSYTRVKDEFEHLLRKVPAIGQRLTSTLERVKDGMRSMMVPGQFFEAFGFRYLGPVDGHDVSTLVDTLRHAKALSGPVLLHVITEKGKGYPMAEDAPDKFHAWPSAAKTDPSVQSYSQIFTETLRQLARKDNRIVAVTAAMLSGSGLTAFQKEFPTRCFDVGIAEQHAATFCAGLATQGLRPVFAVYSTFLQRAYDQLIHDIAIQNLPVLFAVDRAGLVGADGETHQGAFDLAYTRTIPNLTIMVPKDHVELQQMMATAMALEGPSVVRYPRLDVVVDNEMAVPQHMEIGKAELVQEGSDIALLAVGPMVELARRAADLLKENGVAATVVNLRFVKPLDAEMVVRIAQQMPVITIEEGSRLGGVGSAVLECLAEHGIQQRVKLMGLPDTFIPHGSRQALLGHVGLTQQNIVSEALNLLARDH